MNPPTGHCSVFFLNNPPRTLFLGVVLGLLSILPHTLFAQSSKLRFQHFSVEQGLSDNTVTHVMQDKSGLLWISTENGLNVYDGYRFRIFKHHEEDPYSIGSSKITKVLEGDAGLLWVGTEDGLNSYDRVTGRFQQYQLDEEIDAEEIGVEIQALLLAKD